MAVNSLEAQKYADGIELDYTPSGAVTAGEPIELDGTLGLCGIPNSDIAADDKGSLCIAGVFDILKVTGALAVGAKVGWDANGTPVGGSTTGAATGTVGDWDFPIGTCVDAAASGDTSVKVLLNSWRNIDIHEMLPAQAHIADLTATLGTLTGTITPTNAVGDSVADVALPAAITDSSGGADPGDDTVAAIAEAATMTDNSGGADPGDDTIAVITNTTNLTDNGGGTADGTVASQAAPVTLTDNTGGSHDDTLALLTSFTHSWNGATDPTAGEGAALIAAIDVNDRNIADIGNKVIELVTLAGVAQANLKEVTTELATQRTANIALLAAIAQLAAKVNVNSLGVDSASDAVAQVVAKVNVATTALGILEDNQAEFANLLAEAKVDSGTSVAKINAILVALELAGIVLDA